MRKTGTVFALVSFLVISLILSGCTYAFRDEMRAANRAIEDARARGAETQCPDDLNEVLAMREEAWGIYRTCDTPAAIEKLHVAQDKANGLCGIADSDGDGVTDDKDKCPGTPPGVSVDAAGCPPDTDMDGVYDHLDTCPGTPLGATVDTRGCWVLKDVRFDTDMWDIKAQYNPILDEIVDILKKNPSLKVEVQGHTDNMGSAGHNQTLSENRAKSVMQYIVDKGISGSRLTYKGYGLTKPAASNETPEGRAANRRVELKPLQ